MRTPFNGVVRVSQIVEKKSVDSANSLASIPKSPKTCHVNSTGFLRYVDVILITKNEGIRADCHLDTARFRPLFSNTASPFFLSKSGVYGCPVRD